MTTDAKIILREQEKFYKNLYTDTIQTHNPDSGKAEALFRNKNLPSLNDEEKNSVKVL